MSFSDAELAELYFGGVSKDTYVQQVRRNIMDELLRMAPDSARYRDELREFITVEPFAFSADDSLRISHLPMPGVAVGMIPRLSWTARNERPIFVSWSPKALRLYIRRWLRFRIIAFLQTWLPRALEETHELRVLVNAREPSNGAP